MMKHTFSGLGIDVFHEKLDNGLNVYLVPFENRNNYEIHYMTRFGAEINQFVPIGEDKKIKIPYGVAHFLEHKMFEQESGEDPFSFYAKSGTDANAFTGNKRTTYTVYGNKNIEENLEYLLNYVNSPYFTDENVEKEKGIIIEEINMYNDEPEGKLFEQCGKSVFKKHPCRVDIGGTEKSVRSITKEVLYKCYNTFYQPSNMYLIITGNFDKEKILKVIKNNKALNSKISNQPIKVVKVKEPREVNIVRKDLKLNNVYKPKMFVTFKSKIDTIEDEESMKRATALDILLYHLFGSSSTFREEMLKRNLMTFLQSSKEYYDDNMLVELLAETKDPDKLFKEILKTLKTTKITEEDVERIKKVMIAENVYRTDNIMSTMGVISGFIVSYGEPLYNAMDLIKEITLKDVKEARKLIAIDNYALVVGYPKE